MFRDEPSSAPLSSYRLLVPVGMRKTEFGLLDRGSVG